MAEEKEIIGRCGKHVDDRIEILEGVAAIRKRSGMYIGSTGSRGLHQLIEELLFFLYIKKAKI